MASRWRGGSLTRKGREQAAREQAAREQAAREEPFFTACRDGDVAGVVAAVDSDQSLVRCENSDGYTALVLATSLGRQDVVAALLGVGASVDAVDNVGWTALHGAASAGHVEVVAALLGAGASVDAVDNDGCAALHGAASAGHVEVVAALLGAGASVDAVDNDGCTALALHRAASAGHVEVVAALLGAGASVDAVDNDGWTALHGAASAGHKEVVAALLGAGASVDAVNIFRCTALHEAASAGHKEVVAALLGAGASVDAVDIGEWMALFRAALAGHVEVVAALLGAGASVDAVHYDGWTALHRAALAGHVEVVAALLGAGASVDAVHNDGWTALHGAATAGHKEVVSVLLKAGANVNGTEHMRPLASAMQNEHVETVKVLVAWGAATDEGMGPSGPRALRKRGAKVMRKALDETPKMTAEAREKAMTEWQTSNKATVVRVARQTAADRALGRLQEIHNGFFQDPSTLTRRALKEQVTPSLILDVRCLRLAHRVLVFADRVGLFAGLDGGAKEALRKELYERVYRPVLGCREKVDEHLIAALIDDAAKNGLVAPMHVSIMTTALTLRAAVYSELQQINRRLNFLEDVVEHMGQHLYDTMDELRKLKLDLRDKEAHERNVALAKSLVKLGLSLAPIVGSALNVGVDAAVALTESASGAVTAAYQHLADPSNIEAARLVLQGIREATEHLTAEQGEELQKFVKQLDPFQSLEAVEKELSWAAKELKQLTGAEAGGAGDDAPAPDENKWAKPKEVATDVGIEHGVDWPAGKGRGNAAEKRACHPAGSHGADRAGPSSAPRPAPSCPTAPPGVGAAAGTVKASPACAAPSVPATPVPSAVAARRLASPVPPPSGIPQPPAGSPGTTMQAPAARENPFGSDYFADVIAWDCATVASKLAAYITGIDSPAERDEFHADVRANAKEHGMAGGCIARCRNAAVVERTTACLLGSWTRKYGLVVEVKAFIEDATRVAGHA